MTTTKPKLFVTAVRKIRVETPVPVYDATVPVYHNYMLHNGVIVHNTAKKARDNSFQEVLRLTGKIANALRMPLATLLSNKVVQNLLASIGYNHKLEKPAEGLRVKSIFFLSDADVDGKHINALLATLIYRLLPDLYSQGRVFVCDAPLYSAYFKGSHYFGDTHGACFSQLGRGAPKDIVTRAKGWGELSPETLELIAFHPRTRNVIQLKPVAGKEEEYFKAVMSSDTAARKQLLGL